MMVKEHTTLNLIGCFLSIIRVWLLLVTAFGSYHIYLDGNPAYSARYKRTFGFYCDLATVVDEKGFFHIHPNGSPLYSNRWDWCGNFQQQICVVRNEIGEYYHIRTDGMLIHGGPHSYAGDFREGFAVVRGMDGLCRHINLEGQYIYDYSFLDLDVFHKGFARARDDRGWYHINTDGNDISSGERYAEIEPFYNGQAHVRTITGEYLVIDENGNTVSTPVRSESDINQYFQSQAVSYWKPLAIRLGILSGLAGGKPVNSISRADRIVLEQAWIELGLISENGVLSVLGREVETKQKMA